MPELPEVNTVTLALKHHLQGDKICEWQRLSPKLRRPLPDAHEVAGLLQQKIVKVFRQAKSIFFAFGNGQYLHFHLGMTGFFSLSEKNMAPVKHEHLRVFLESGRCLSFHDARRFGVVELLSALPKPVPEPLKNDLTLDCLKKILRKGKRPIKTTIMDQSLIAGVGNIYASEALFAARILPDRPSSSLTANEVKRLHQALLKVIGRSIESGLQSLLPNFTLDRHTAHFDIETLVYGQAGTTCPQCGKAIIENLCLAGRSSFFCPNCQK